MSERISTRNPVLFLRRANVPVKRAMGWLPDYPDFRDYTVRTDTVEDRFRRLGETHSVASMLERIGVGKVKPRPKVNYRRYCSPVEDQGELGSCTAHAGIGLLEYYERRVHGRHLDASRLFLYKATRNLMGLPGDTGAFLRTTMGAMRLFGVPPEQYWPYEVARFDEEPSAFCYSFAREYQSMQYFRLDPPSMTRDKVLSAIREALAGGVPSMFGFVVYDSYEQAESDGRIPFPCPREKRLGGHAVVAVGYDDGMEVTNELGGESTKGAILIRNSWGKEWGDRGYGWLPYEYVIRGQALDWWSLLKSEWVDVGEFGEG